MRYMITLYADWSDAPELTPEEMGADLERWNSYNREVVDAGVFLAGEPLEGADTATTLQVGAEERIVVDGPFAETKEQLGGFYLLECADLDEALDWARKVPVSRGSIEVRAVRDLTPFGYVQPVAKAAASA